MACTCQPGKALCASCLKSVYDRNALSTIPVSNNGEYARAQAAVFEKAFMNNIVEDIENNPLSEATKKYPDFYAAVQDINNDFLKRPAIVKQLPDYPVLNKRLEKGGITPLEFAGFIKDSNYTPATAIISSNAQGPRFLDELDKYYNGDFADSVLGGFCGLFSSIFGAVDAFFDMIGAIDGFVQDVFSLINKIKNIEDPIRALFEKIKVTALIKAIKEKVGEMVKQAIKKVCQSIANFDVSAITGPIESPAQAQMCMKVEEEKSALQDLCGEDNAQRIKDKIQGLIDYAVGLFSNPSLEEIMALISRICAMATGIEGLFKQLKNPLNSFAERYDEVFNTLSNASNRVTGEAIRGGAIRPTDEFRKELINRARASWEKAGNVKPPTVEELKDLGAKYSWEKIKDNTNDKIRIQGGWVTNMEPAHEGWTRLDPVVKVLLIRLQEKAKKKELIKSHLILNSGFRSQQYNTKIKGAKNSQHMLGMAMDITWPGFKPNDENTEILIREAKKIGFRGVGYYDSFIHLDIGPERWWDERSKSVAARTAQPVTTPAPKTAASPPEKPASVRPPSNYANSGNFVDGMYHLFEKYDNQMEFDLIEAQEYKAPVGTTYNVTWVDAYGSTRIEIYKVVQSKRLASLTSLVQINDPEEVERYRKQEFDL